MLWARECFYEGRVLGVLESEAHDSKHWSLGHPEAESALIPLEYILPAPVLARFSTLSHHALNKLFLKVIVIVVLVAGRKCQQKHHLSM